MNLRQDAASVLQKGLENHPVSKAVNQPSNSNELKVYKVPVMNSLVDDNLNNKKIQPLFGNRCGHQPSWPRMAVMPLHHKKRFPAIERAKKNVNKTYSAPLALPFGKVYFHSDKPIKKGRYRKVRSEMRETIACQLTIAILHHNNIQKMQLGYFKAGVFVPYGIKYLQRVLDISETQLRRAMKILKTHGYIKVEQRRFKRLNGSFGSLQSIIKVDPSLYLDLGITEEELKNLNKKEVIAQQKAIKQSSQPTKPLKSFNENPGKDRKREYVPVYRDYTGVAAKNHLTQADHTQGATLLGDLLAKLRNSS